MRATKIDPGTVDVQGSDANLFVGGTSEISYACILQLAQGLATKLLDNAEKDDLDRYAWDRYQLTRKGASAALGSVIFTRPNGTGPAGSVPIGTVLNTLSGFSYVTTTAAPFTSSTGTLTDVASTASVRAVQAGKLTQAAKNTITQFAQQGALFDQTIGVNNPLPTAGGEDAEDDDTFRNRIRGFWTTARRGVLSAISYGAIQVPGVVSAVAVEVINSIGQPARMVNLYIADSTGVASAELAALVSAQLLDFRAAGILVIISTSIPIFPPVQLHLTFRTGVDTAGLGAQVQAAVVNYVNSLPVSATLSLAAIGSVLQRFVPQGLIIQTPGTIAAPIGDVVPPPGQTIRATLSSVSLS